VVDAAGVNQHPLGAFMYQYFVRKAFHNLLQKNLGLFIRLHVDFILNVIKKFAHLFRGVQTVFHAMQPRYHEIITRIAVPTLILWGEDDEIFPTSTAESLHTMIKNSELHIVSGNHDWCLFTPEKLDTMIETMS